MVKSIDCLISQLRKISEEDWREVLSERLENLNVDHTRVETSPEARQMAERFMLRQSSKPSSDVEKEYVDDAAVMVSEEEDDAHEIVSDGVSRKKRSSHGHQSSSSHTMTRPRTPMIERSRSTTSVQSPNPDPDYSPSSFVSKSKNRRHTNVDKTSHKKGKVVRDLEVEPIQTTPPEWLLNVMRGKNGYNPKLISTRPLFKSDVDKLQARLSVPLNQVKSPDFLTEDETRIIYENTMKRSTDGLNVDLVDPQMNEHEVNLRKWPMGNNWIYVFVDGWNNLVADNKFKVDDRFPLWSFRSGEGSLWFALVPPTTTTSTDSSHCGGSTSSSHGNSLLSSDGAFTSGEADHVPLLRPRSPLVRDPSHSGQGCLGESSSHST